MQKLSQTLSKLKKHPVYWFLLIIILLSLVIALTSNPLTKNPSPQPSDQMPPKNSPNPSTSQYTCPENGWVNCMPGPDLPKPECSQDAINWFENNCPNFQGVAQ